MREAFVGIDVSNRKLDVSFLDGDGRPLRPDGSFPNEPDGWVALKAAVVAVFGLVGRGGRVVCGMESTSNMHVHAARTLRSIRRKNLEVHVLNPMAVKNFGRALLKDSKTDRGDSQLIAGFLARMRPEVAAPVPEEIEELKEITRTRRRLVEERTTHKNRLHKLLRQHFPGYRSVLGNALSKRLLIAIAEYPSPDAILAVPAQELAQTRTGERHLLGDVFAEKLHALATQAPRLELRIGTRLLLRSTARRILELTEHVAELDAAIEEMVDELFPGQVLTSIPGIGKVSAAAILAEIGDITRFKSKRDFVGYCGLYPVVWESGDTRKRFRMTTKGNRMLKMTLLVASAAARRFNPAIAHFYERLRRRDKSVKAAGGAIARKLAELVYTLLSRGEAWSPEQAMRGIEKAHLMAA